MCVGLRMLYPHDPAVEAALDAAAAAEDPSSTDSALGINGFRGLCRVKLCADLRRCSGGKIDWLSGGTGSGRKQQPPLVVVLGAHNLANYFELVIIA